MPDWGRVKEVFGTVLDAEESTRDEVLERACAGDEELRSQVRALLGSHGRAEFLAEPLPIERAGPFELGAELGRGAFGVVRLGVQHRPVHREVAVKLLHDGTDARGVLARFRGEQETLAQLDHPGIARLIECGSDERGRPWFAMDLVRGEPITVASQARGLDVRRRVEMMVQVCRAVQHAHQRGVIHRDLKPSNIIVGEDDGRLRARVIDFGIAKALSRAAGAMSAELALTREHQLIGTPAYMSPEQAAGAAVETSSDVYALGAVLFELLTGRPPVDQAALVNAAPGELSQVIRASEPGRVSASSRLAGAGDRALLRELDWVVLAAIEKDPARRISSAGDLADELQAVLDGLPTRSGPPGARVRLRAAVRRHPLATGLIAAAALLAIGITAGSVAGLIQARRAEATARTQARRAEAARAFVLDDALGRLATGLEHGRDPSVSDLLDAASANLDKRFTDDPHLKVEVLQQLTRGYLRVFKYERVLELGEMGFGLAQTMTPPDYEAAVEFGTLCADVNGRLGRHPQQIDWVVRSAAIARAHLRADSPAALTAETGDALVSSIRGEGGNARQRLERVVSMAQGRAEALHALKLALTYLYIQAEIALDSQEAARWAQQRLAAAESGERLPGEVMDSASVLLRHLILLGRFDEAEALFARMLAAHDGSRSTPGMMGLLRQGARLELRKGNLEQAGTYAQRSYEMATGELGLEDAQAIECLEVLAQVATAGGRHAEAVDWATRARNGVESNMGASSREARWMSLELALLQHRANDGEGAKASIDRALRGLGPERAEQVKAAVVSLIGCYNDPRPAGSSTPQLAAEFDRMIGSLDGDWGRDRAAQLGMLAFIGDLARGAGDAERGARIRAMMIRLAAGK